MTNGTLLLGRLMMAACFLTPALKRVSNISGFSFQLAAAGIPYPSVVATVVIVAEVFGPLALVLGLAPRCTAAALIAVTVATTGTLHRFWEVPGTIARQADQAAFLASLGLMAGLLFYAASGPGAWSWQAWWRRAIGHDGAPTRKPTRARTSRPRPAPVDEEFADAA
jgi:putative oxidoreductase